MSANPSSNRPPQTPEATELVLVREGHRFAFSCRPGEEPRLLERLSRLADDPSSELTWRDAARLSHQISRRLTQPQPTPSWDRSA